MELPQDEILEQHKRRKDMYQKIQCVHAAQGPEIMAVWLQKMYA